MRISISVERIKTAICERFGHALAICKWCSKDEQARREARDRNKHLRAAMYIIERGQMLMRQEKVNGKKIPNRCA